MLDVRRLCLLRVPICDHVLSSWHLDDIESALRLRGWQGPSSLPTHEANLSGEFGEVGHIHLYTRADREIRLYFWTDIPPPSDVHLLEVCSVSAGREPEELWLHRTRDSKWKRDLFKWADAIST